MADRAIHTVAPNKSVVSVVQQIKLTGNDGRLHPVNCTGSWTSPGGSGSKSPITQSWKQVAVNASCRYGTFNWVIGAYKNVTLNIPADDCMSSAISGTYRAVIIGYRHNIEYEDDNCIHFSICQTDTGIPVGFYGAPINVSPSTKIGGWAGCKLRNWLNTTFYNALPADLRAAIIPITKYSDNGGGSGATYDTAQVTPTKEKIWITTMYEMTGQRSPFNPAELTYTKQYPYFYEVNPVVIYRHDATTTTVEGWSRSPRYSSDNTTDTSMNWCSYISTGTSISHSGHTASFRCAIQPCFAVGARHTDLIRKQYD